MSRQWTDAMRQYVVCSFCAGGRLEVAHSMAMAPRQASSNEVKEHYIPFLFFYVTLKRHHGRKKKLYSHENGAN